MVDVRTNLLKNKRILSEKDYQRERSYLRMAVIGLVVVVSLVAAISIWNFVLSRKLAGIEQTITSTTKDMQGLSQASAQQVYLKSRLKLVTGFLAQRGIARESLQNVLTSSIPGTYISAVAFEGESGIKVEYGADSVVPLKKLLDYFESDTGYFVQVVSSGLTRAKDGSYQLSLVFTLPMEGK